MFNCTDKKLLLLLYCLFFTHFLILADDTESKKEFQKGTKEAKAGNWKTAANKFVGAELYADSQTLKFNAIQAQANAYQKAGLEYKEFQCIQRLIKVYPDQIDFNQLLEREFEIGNNFYNGYRESPFQWFPWIKDNDRALEIYETIMRQSPYVKFAPEMMIKMGFLYIKAKNHKKAISIYNNIIKSYPDSNVTHLAYLDLANIHLQLAKRGDGDGSNARAARKILIDFIKKYPNSSEILWAKNSLKKTYDLEANTLLNLATFYKTKDPNTAKRYLREILVNFPETKEVAGANQLLNEIDMPLYPNPTTNIPEQQSKYQMYDFQDTGKETLITPENSSGTWLIPITNLKMDKQKKLQEKYKNQL